MTLWQRFFGRVKEHQAAASLGMTREQLYDALRSPHSETLLVGLEQHLRMNGSMDARVESIQKAEGPRGYWYMLGYCKAHKDLAAFLKRARRPEQVINAVEEHKAPRTGGVARYVGEG